MNLTESIDRRLCGLLVAAALVVPAVSAAADGDTAAKTIELTGYFTDEWCGKSNANPEGAECARRCAAKGSAMALFADGKLYKVTADDKQKAIDNVGVEVDVKARVRADGTLEIASVSPTRRTP